MSGRAKRHVTPSRIGLGMGRLVKNGMSAISSNLPHADDSDDSATPKTLFGYEIIGPLAQGAGSFLYYAICPTTNVTRVLKHVMIHGKKDKRFFEQLRTEYLLGKKVTSTGVRRAIEIRLARTWLGSVTEAAVILEYCEGKTLEEFVPRDPAERVAVFLRAAAAIAALNDFGYVHCDIKPANIVVTNRTHATIIDLGQACKIGSVKERIQGTPNFMAPEQTRKGEMTPKTDVFCFGATMYMALTGQPIPTMMTSGRGYSAETIDAMITPPNSIDPTISPELSQLILDCVKTAGNDRPENMHVVVSRLREEGINLIKKLEGDM